MVEENLMAPTREVIYGSSELVNQKKVGSLRLIRYDLCNVRATLGFYTPSLHFLIAFEHASGGISGHLNTIVRVKVSNSLSRVHLPSCQCREFGNENRISTPILLLALPCGGTSNK